MSCAGCHDPPRVRADAVARLARPVCRKAAGGRFSQRNAPSLLYVRYVPRRHFYQDDDAPAPSPFGGLFSDGRADTLAEQIRGPLFDPNEMNNRSPAALLRKIDATELAPDLAARFGAPVRRDPEQLVRALAVEAYLQSDEMAPFTSRFDVPAHAQATRAGRNARPRAVPESRQGQLHELPYAVGNIEPPGAFALHRFRLRRDRGAAQPRAAGKPRSAPFRQRAVRHRTAAALARADPMVRLPAHAGAAQRRGQADVHAQRRVHDAATRSRSTTRARPTRASGITGPERSTTCRPPIAATSTSTRRR